MEAEQLPIDFYAHDLTLKFAQAIVKHHIHSYETGAHNDRWTETECAFCHQSQSWSHPFAINHKDDCVVLLAQEYIQTHQ